MFEKHRRSSLVHPGSLSVQGNDVLFTTQVPPLVARLPSSFAANDRQYGIAIWAMRSVYEPLAFSHGTVKIVITDYPC